MKLFNSIILLIFCLAFTANIHSQTTYDVTWNKFYESEVVNDSLKRLSGSLNIGVGTSQEMLFGKVGNDVFNGYVEYQAVDTFEVKSFGFVSKDDPALSNLNISYGFSFIGGGKVLAFSPYGNAEKVSFSVKDVFTIERSDNDVLFKINSSLYYSVPIDPTENLLVRAILESDGSSFSNVMASFRTAEIIVNPLIDNVDKTISLGVSGGETPYFSFYENGILIDSVSRTSGQYAPTLNCFLSGKYDVKVKDSSGHLYESGFSIGSDITWGSFYKSQQTGFVLSKNIVDDYWGTAVGTDTFSVASSTWCEYVIEKEVSGQKALGFVPKTVTVRSTRNISTGVLITESALQIVYRGTVVFTTDYYDHDVLRLELNNGIATIYKNNRQIYSTIYPSTSDALIAGLVYGDGTIDHVNYEINPVEIIQSVYGSADSLGSIALQLPTALNGPFSYFISEDYINDPATIRTILADTFGIEMDSLGFYAGATDSTSYIFEDLHAGTYHVSVFDTNGARLLGSYYSVQRELTLKQGKGLDIVKDQIEGTQSEAIGSLQLFTSEDENCDISISCKSFGDTSSIVYFGWMGDNDTLEFSSDIQYGYYINPTTKLFYLIEQGVVGSTAYRYRNGKDFKLSILDGNLNFLIGDDLLKTVSPSANSDFSFGLKLNPADVVQIKYTSIKDLIKPMKHTFQAVQYLTCDNMVTPAIKFSITPMWFYKNAQSVYSIVNQTTGEIIVSSAITNSGTVNVITTPLQGGTLHPGIYTVSGYINAPGYPTFSYNLYFGYEADWWMIDNAYKVNALNTYSTLASNISNWGFETARSSNIMKPSVQNGWIEFKPVNGNNLEGLNVFRFTTQNLTTSPVNFYSNENYVLFARINWPASWPFLPSNFSVFNIGGVQEVRFLPMNRLAHLIFDQNNVTFDQVGASPSVYPRTSFTGIARCESNANNLGFENVITSFDCGQPSDLYAKLKYDIDGFYHIMNDGKIKFVFDQEYDADNLIFNIYNVNDELVKTEADFPTVSTTYGMNYLTLDVTTAAQCLGKGFFYLEVINSKKEKSYLRFHNNYSSVNCSDY